jgi:hypothetical protein
MYDCWNELHTLGLEEHGCHFASNILGAATDLWELIGQEITGFAELR